MHAHAYNNYAHHARKIYPPAVLAGSQRSLKKPGYGIKLHNYIDHRIENEPNFPGTKIIGTDAQPS